MRFFIMFMFMSIGISYAETVHSQNAAMEFRFQDVTIEKALKEIEKKTGYNFFYNTKDFNVKRKISFSAKGMNLSEVLNGIFANSQVDYVINGTDIVLKRREEVSNVSNEKYQIKGSVRDGNGEPVIGASVVLKGHTETGVITDIDGNFVLTVPAKKVTLSISYIGYDPVNVEATVGTFVKVVMKESSQTLNEVVVVGYGTQKKESVVGSVQMVKPDELKVPSSQLSTGFAGRLAGVVAVQRSGEPGADGADFWIRGISTFNGTRSPLIIIDGVQASSGDLNAIDPEVIESFSVLKDATATALYGSRGANGVMIVKTKSGRESDKAIVNIRLENAYSTHTKTPKFVDGVRYMEMYNEAVLTRGTGEVLYSDNKIAGTRAGLDPLIYPNVNWYDELFRSGAMNQNINVTIRGGSKKLDYFSSVSVNHDSGVLRNTDDFSYKNNLNIMRYVFQNNFNLNLSKSSKLSLNLNVQLRDYSGPTSNTSDLFGMVMESNPVDFPVRFPDHSLGWKIRW
ncbi:SusC/RagA family TonB-linked outer membrane protein [Bacteroides sp. 43_46]|uniref:SusC/RagA family TonB-linked outer membrane protein n=1 Tax=Bacteroides sp. 43_46 TaxID=1897051 RepID=UPI00257C224B|nr:SusC/RagA family TonB-linked outer membrane protein [Bacteroides sp. 43_46]